MPDPVITCISGFLYSDGEPLSLQDSDQLAQDRGYTYTEQLVREFEMVEAVAKRPRLQAKILALLGREATPQELSDNLRREITKDGTGYLWAGEFLWCEGKHDCDQPDPVV